MSNSRQNIDEAKKVIQQVSKDANADLVLWAGPIVPPTDTDFTKQVEVAKLHENVMLIVATGGGSAESAYRIAKCLQRIYGEGRISLLVESYCKSAGTLLALGADELIMSDTAELGPLDVQLTKPDELAEWTSGLTPVQAISTLRDEAFRAFEEYFLALRFKSGQQITTKTAIETAQKLTVGLFSPIFGQIDPMRVGEVQRANQIALEYGRRLSRNNAKEGALRSLIDDYPSHGFVIDREEAAELFTNVRCPTDNEKRLIEIAQPFVDEGLNGSETVLFFLNQFLYNPLDKGSVSHDSQHDEPRTTTDKPGATGKAHSSEGVGAASEARKVRKNKLKNTNGAAGNGVGAVRIEPAANQ